MSATQQNLAILFVDVSGSVELYESLGDAAAFREVHECLAVFRNAVTQHGGRVVKTIGDGALCSFPDVGAAVAAACEMQTRVLHRQSAQKRKIGIRIGLQHGPVLVTDDDVFGDTVNTAARLSQLAASGQIITTAGSVERLPSLQRRATRQLDTFAVKGKQDAVAVFEVLWQSGGDYTLQPRSAGYVLRDAGVSVLRLVHGGKETVVVGSISMGRNAGHGMPLRDPMASRDHARIERRKDKFFLVDQSSNGTFVRLKGGEEFTLRREEMPLYGSGAIAFGHSPHADDAEVVAFSLEASDSD